METIRTTRITRVLPSIAALLIGASANLNAATVSEANWVSKNPTRSAKTIFSPRASMPRVPALGNAMLRHSIVLIGVNNR
jgi:hypothetical protein